MGKTYCNYTQTIKSKQRVCQHFTQVTSEIIVQLKHVLGLKCSGVETSCYPCRHIYGNNKIYLHCHENKDICFIHTITY